MEPQCKKVAYSSKKFADMDVARIAKISTRERKPIRSYKCDYCGTWHLTGNLNEVSVIIRDQLDEIDKLNAEIATHKKRIGQLISQGSRTGLKTTTATNTKLTVLNINLKARWEKQKLQANFYRKKFNEQSKEFKLFKREINALIRKLEESNGKVRGRE